MKNLVKNQSAIVWTVGNRKLLRYFKGEEKEILRKVLSEKLFQAISLFTRETPEQNVSLMIGDILEDYSFEPVGVIISAIDNIRKGKYKVFGLVTPNVIREALAVELEDLAIERENEHLRFKSADTPRGVSPGTPATNAIEQIRRQAQKITKEPKTGLY